MSETLYHYGVKGMRWGHRKRYEEASKRYKKLQGRSTTAKGMITKQNVKDASLARAEAYKKYKSAIKSKADESEIQRLGRDYEKADFNEVKIRAKRKGQQAELKSYARQAYVRGGEAGSYNDQSSGGRSTNIYNELNINKGKDYADNVMKKTRKMAIGIGVTTATVLAGLTIIDVMDKSGVINIPKVI